jgi:hypothetical protein
MVRRLVADLYVGGCITAVVAELKTYKSRAKHGKLLTHNKTHNINK